MNKDQKATLKRGFIALGVVILILALMSVGDQQSDMRTTVHSKYRNGLMAIYKTLKDSGINTQAWIEPISQKMPDGTLFILSPVTPPGIREVDELKKWVAKGNTLVFSNEDSFVFEMAIEDEYSKEPGIKARPALKCALTEDVDSLRISSTYNNIPDHWSFDDIAMAPTAGPGNRFQKNKEAVETDTGQKTLALFTTEKRPVAGIIAWGKGRVVLLSSPSALSNYYIGKDNNADFVLNTIQRTTRTKPAAIFYEYGNGYARMLPGAGLLTLISGPVKTGLLMMLIAFLVLLFLEAHRFGPVKILQERTRFRSEYLSSLANLLNRGGGTDVVLDELGRKFISDIIKELKIAHTDDVELIVNYARSKGFSDCEHLSALLTEAKKEHTSVSNESAILQAKQWNKMRKEISKLR